MKIILVLIITMLFFGGCSDKIPGGIATEYETTVSKKEAFLKESITQIEKGSMYTYSYSYTDTDGNNIDGKVFILKILPELNMSETEAFADTIEVRNHEYVALDYTYLSDPDIQVRNSYRATKEKERECVINIILDYAEKNPSKWERSVASLKNEWYWHNSAYEAGYNTNRAKHVDFNNKDEINYPTLNPFNNE